jgi:exopolysaccharide production protein ExoZ
LICRLDLAMNAKRRFESIQFLRFLAAFLVVLFHISKILNRDFGTVAQQPIGQAGVDIFFVISGFIIAYAADGKTAKEFLGRRLIRVVPLYWFLTAGVFATALIAPQLLFSTTGNIENFAKSLLFIPYRKESGAIEPVLFVGWTLNYEMFFYATFAAAMAFSRNRIAAVTALFVLLAGVGYAFHPTHSVLLNFYTSGIILEFAAGMWVFRFYKDRNFQPVRGLQALMVIGFILLAAQVAWPQMMPREIFFGIPAVLIVLGALSWHLPAGRLTAVFVALGDASYSMYLSHVYNLYAVAKVAKAFLGSGSIVITTAVMIGSVVLTSLLLYRYFERPMTDALTSLFFVGKPKTAAVIGLAEASERKG